MSAMGGKLPVDVSAFAYQPVYMDALATAPTDTAEPLSRTVRALIVGVVVLVLALDLGERATLVDPIPLPLTFASGAAFFAAGVWLSFRLRPPTYYGPVRRLMAHIGAPIFALFMGTFLARTIVEAAAVLAVGIGDADGFAPPEAPRRAATRGVFPFRFTRQAVLLPGSL